MMRGVINRPLQRRIRIFHRTFAVGATVFPTTCDHLASAMHLQLPARTVFSVWDSTCADSHKILLARCAITEHCKALDGEFSSCQLSGIFARESAEWRSWSLNSCCRCERFSFTPLLSAMLCCAVRSVGDSRGGAGGDNGDITLLLGV